MYEYKAEVIEIIDGDTIVANVALGFDINHKIKFRLSRINTPEIHGVKKDSIEYEKGIASQKFVIDFMKLTNNKIRIVTNKDKTEKYGRYLAEIYAIEGPFKDKNLNEELLVSGFAKLYKD